MSKKVYINASIERDVFLMSSDKILYYDCLIALWSVLSAKRFQETVLFARRKPYILEKYMKNKAMFYAFSSHLMNEIFITKKLWCDPNNHIVRSFTKWFTYLPLMLYICNSNKSLHFLAWYNFLFALIILIGLAEVTRLSVHLSR